MIRALVFALCSPSGRAWKAQEPSECRFKTPGRRKRIRKVSFWEDLREGTVIGYEVVPRCANLCNEPDFKLYDLRFRSIAFHLDPRYLHDFRCAHCDAVVSFHVLCRHVFPQTASKGDPNNIDIVFYSRLYFTASRWRLVAVACPTSRRT